MNAFYRHLQLFLTLSLVLGGQAQFQGTTLREIMPYVQFWIERHPLWCCGHPSLHRSRACHGCSCELGSSTLSRWSNLGICLTFSLVAMALLSSHAYSEHAAGRLRGPENLFESILPASKGEEQAHYAEFEQYKNETTTVMNALVTELNILTPVRTSPPAPTA